MEAAQKILGVKVDYALTDRRNGDVARTYADVTKAKQQFGWSATYGIEDIITHAFQWEMKNKRKK